MLNGTGLSIGLSENSPPYKYRESLEFQRKPLATAGGPDGCEKPCKAGEEICQLVDRFRERKLLSAVNGQYVVLRHIQGDVLHVSLVWLASVFARPP